MSKRTLHELQEVELLLPPLKRAIWYALRDFIRCHGWELTKLWIQSGARKIKYDSPGGPLFPGLLSYTTQVNFDPVIWNNGKYKSLVQIQDGKQRKKDNLKVAFLLCYCCGTVASIYFDHLLTRWLLFWTGTL
ncbi:MAG: hypothetical protein Q9214_006018, partial [Letrouitia sp. 1 TL-2023]